MTGKWHLSGAGNGKNGTTPYDRGFEDVFSLLSSGANHFNPDPYYAGGRPVFSWNGKIVPRPNNGTYSNDLYTNIMLDQIKKYHGDDGKPMFMYIAFQVAHSPFQAPEQYIKKYQGVYDIGYDKIREQRFEIQKQLGIWPAYMQLPKRIPPVQPWDSLTSDQKAYRSRVLQVYAAMVDNMDYNIGKVIKYLKDIGQYDNTLIIFASDNGSSEPVEAKNFITTGVTAAEQEAFVNKFNNSLPNIGNANSLVNYGAWDIAHSVSPLSYFKRSQGEGGVRAPLIIKLPRVVSSSIIINNQASQTNKYTQSFCTCNRHNPYYVRVCRSTAIRNHIQGYASSSNNGKIYKTTT